MRMSYSSARCSGNGMAGIQGIVPPPSNNSRRRPRRTTRRGGDAKQPAHREELGTLRATWRSQAGFIWAAAGSAIGLGNVWRFPTVAAQEGGGAFLLVFLGLLIIVGVPMMMGEIAVGRRAARGPAGAYRTLAPGTRWHWLGYLYGAINVSVLSFYASLTGACLAYMARYVAALFRIMPAPAPGGPGGTSGPLLMPGEAVLWLLITIGIVAYVSARGIQQGIEKVTSRFVPLLLIILAVLVIRVSRLDGAMEGIVWFLTPRWEDVSFRTLLAALAQLFFSLSIGSGLQVTYASYLDRTKSDIVSSSMLIAASDTAVGMLAGLAVIPALFAFNSPIVSGPELVFHSLTGIFAAMPWGEFFGALFFAALSIAALGSSFSILEVPVTTMVDEARWPRLRAVLSAAAVSFVLGIPSALSMSGVSAAAVAGRPFIDIIDHFTTNMVLPVSGGLSVIFIGWVWGAANARDEIALGARAFRTAPLWTWAIRYILPVAIVLIIVGQFVL